MNVHSSRTTPESGDSRPVSLEAGVVTADAARLVEFYVDGLGFSIAQTLEFPQGVVHRLSRGLALLKIYQPAIAPESRPLAEPWHGVGGFGYAALHVVDVGAEVARAVKAGARVINPVANHRPGAWFALIADPENNVWELLQENEARGKG